MPAPGSVTAWIEQLKAGDAAAAAPLWQGYFRRLVGLARQRLGAAPRGAADEEDVALSAFASFCRAAAQGRFPRLDDRDHLWTEASGPGKARGRAGWLLPAAAVLSAA